MRLTDVFRLENLAFSILIVIILILAWILYQNYNSIRNRHKRALIKQFKANLDMQYVTLDQGFQNFEKDMQRNLEQKLSGLQLETAIPQSVKQAAHQSYQTSNFSSIKSQTSTPNA